MTGHVCEWRRPGIHMTRGTREGGGTIVVIIPENISGALARFHGKKTSALWFFLDLFYQWLKIWFMSLPSQVLSFIRIDFIALPQWGNAIKSPWECTVSSPYASWYGLKWCQELKPPETKQSRYECTVTSWYDLRCWQDVKLQTRDRVVTDHVCEWSRPGIHVTEDPGKVVAQLLW